MMRRGVIRRVIGEVRKIMSALWGADCARRTFIRCLNCATPHTIVSVTLIFRSDCFSTS